MKTYQRTFVVAALFLMLLPSRGADVSFYGIVRQKLFNQTSNAAPTPAVAGGFRFQSWVDSSGADLITDASLTIPGGGQRVFSADGSYSYSYGEQFETLSALNTAYGTGTYTLAVDSVNDPFSYAQLPMPADDYSPAPFLTNYVAAQSVNPSNDFTLYWSGFTGGTVADFVEVQIRDSDGNTAYSSGEKPGAPGALDGTATSFLIPAFTLNPGETYTAEIMFAKISVYDTSSIPGAQGVIAFATQTSVNLKTTGTQPPLLLTPLGFVGSDFRIRLATQPGKNYQMEFSPNLIGWTNIGFLNATGSETLFIDSSVGNSRRFYRAYRVPNSGN